MRASLHSSTTHPPFLGPQYQIQLPAHQYRISATVTSARSARIIGSRPRPTAPPSRSSGYQVPCEGRFSHPTVGFPAPSLSFQRYDLSPTVLYPLAISARFAGSCRVQPWAVGYIVACFLSASFAMACHIETRPWLLSYSSTFAHSPYQARNSAG